MAHVRALAEGFALAAAGNVNIGLAPGTKLACASYFSPTRAKGALAGWAASASQFGFDGAPEMIGPSTKSDQVVPGMLLRDD